MRRCPRDTFESLCKLSQRYQPLHPYPHFHRLDLHHHLQYLILVHLAPVIVSEDVSHQRSTQQ